MVRKIKLSTLRRETLVKKYAERRGIKKVDQKLTVITNSGEPSLRLRVFRVYDGGKGKDGSGDGGAA